MKYSRLKKARQTIKTPVKVSGNRTTLSYAKVKGKSSFTVSKKTGTITIKKGVKKGTYTVKIKVTTAANTKYESASKTISIRIKIK